jgi:hypothetical protein
MHACSQDYTIRDDADWSFIALGDIRSGYGIYENLVDIIDHFSPPPLFIMVMGDITSEPGNELEWMRFWNISKPLTDKTSLYTLVGNHDVDSIETEEIYKNHVVLPGNELYYSFCYEDCYFIVLDTEISGEEKSIVNEQYDWLLNELDSASGNPEIKYTIIFMHRPLYPQGRYRNQVLKNADELHFLFESYPKVRLVIASHEHQFHCFKRNGILHIISGGGGAPLYTENGGDYYHFVKVGFYESEERINIKSIGIFGETVENFNL